MLGDRKEEWLAARLEDLDYGDIDGICAAARVYPHPGVTRRRARRLPSARWTRQMSTPPGASWKLRSGRTRKARATRCQVTSTLWCSAAGCLGCLAEFGGRRQQGTGGALLPGGAGRGGAGVPEGQELLQAGGGLQGGVQDHVTAGGAGVGFDRGQPGDDGRRPARQVEDRIGHAVECGRVQRQTFGRRDLSGGDAAFDGERLGSHRVGLGGPQQRPGQPEADQRHRFLTAADVQPDAERPGQQRLQLRDVQDHGLTLGHSSAHERRDYRQHPGRTPPNRLNVPSCSPRPVTTPWPPGCVGTLVGDISAPGGWLSPLSVRLLLRGYFLHGELDVFVTRTCLAAVYGSERADVQVSCMAGLVPGLRQQGRGRYSGASLTACNGTGETSGRPPPGWRR